MAQMPTRPMAWGPLFVSMAVGVALAGIIGWRINLQSLDEQIKSKQGALKKLTLSGGILPNQEVMDYLVARQTALEQRYQRLVQTVAAPPVADAAKADPQLYFQEQFHEVQRTLERLAAARGIAVPEQLGFPKELPPSDTVPRLLVQLSLMQEAAEVILEQGITVLSSLKVEDPETVPDDENTGAFLIRLPVRVRFAGSLPSLLKVLSAIQRSSPLIDVRSLHLLPASMQSNAPSAAAPAQTNASSPTGQAKAPVQTVAKASNPDQLEVELLLARYLVSTSEPAPDAAEAAGNAPVQKKSAPSKTKRATAKPERP